MNDFEKKIDYLTKLNTKLERIERDLNKIKWFLKSHYKEPIIHFKEETKKGIKRLFYSFYGESFWSLLSGKRKETEHDTSDSWSYVGDALTNEAKEKIINIINMDLQEQKILIEQELKDNFYV